MKDVKLSMMSLAAIMSAGCFIPCEGVGHTEGLDATIERWREDSANPDFYCNVRVVGACTGGNIVFLKTVDIDSGSTSFFDASTGQFLGSQCFGFPFFFWINSPIAFFCQEGMVTESFCGGYAVGETIRP